MGRDSQWKIYSVRTKGTVVLYNMVTFCTGTSSFCYRKRKDLHANIEVLHKFAINFLPVNANLVPQEKIEIRVLQPAYNWWEAGLER